MSVALIAENLSLPMPTRLADGLGLKGTLPAKAGYTPSLGSPVQSDNRPIRRQTYSSCYYTGAHQQLNSLTLEARSPS